MKPITVVLVSIGLSLSSQPSAFARGGAGAAAAAIPRGGGAPASSGAAAIPRGGGAAAVPRGAGSFSPGTTVGAIRGSAAASMFRAGRSGSSSSHTLADEAGSIRGTLSTEGQTGIIRNSAGEVTATLRNSGGRVYFHEPNTTQPRAYAEEGVNGTLRFYRLNESGEFVFEGSEPAPASGVRSPTLTVPAPAVAPTERIEPEATITAPAFSPQPEPPAAPAYSPPPYTPPPAPTYQPPQYTPPPQTYTPPPEPARAKTNCPACQRAVEFTSSIAPDEFICPNCNVQNFRKGLRPQAPPAQHHALRHDGARLNVQANGRPTVIWSDGHVDVWADENSRHYVLKPGQRLNFPNSGTIHAVPRSSGATKLYTQPSGG